MIIGAIAYGGLMEEKRRFNRVVCEEKAMIEFNNYLVRAKLINISLNGALVEIENDIIIRQGDTWKIALLLANTDIILEFRSKVVHRNKNMAGVKFIHLDLDTMIHLRGFIEARTMNLEQVAKEFAYLT
jgi:hypothetical protein